MYARLVEESLQMTGTGNLPIACAVYSLSVGESALVEQLDKTCSVNRTAALICDCALISSC